MKSYGKVIEKLYKNVFESLKNRYENELESIKSSEFVFDYVHLLYYKCHKITPNRGESYIDSPDRIKNRKWTTNSINKKDNKYFQYAVTFTLNHEEIKKQSAKNNKY